MVEVKKDPGIIRGMKAAGWVEHDGYPGHTKEKGTIVEYHYHLYHKTRGILAEVKINMQPDESDWKDAVEEE